MGRCERGYQASPMTKESFEGIPKASLERPRTRSRHAWSSAANGVGALYAALCLAASRTPWPHIPDARSSSLQNTPLATIDGRFW